VRCGENAADCAVRHVLPELGGTCTRTRGGAPVEWAAACPVCHAAGKLTLTAKGRTLLRYCQRCKAPQEALTAALAALLPCFWPPGARPSRRPGLRVEPGDLAALALSGLPPTAKDAQLLVMSGMTVTEALDKLGIDRTTRYRIRLQLSQYCDKTAGQ
jgi:hypothetical protein